ncbi:DUF7503 family protein [Halorarum halobium]|nr:hypothetical protein [Halobaculum sp. XH14]
MPENTAMAAFLAEHPKLIGALFTMTLLLSQAGAVAANGSSTAGP